jgi:hypothetical protein
LLASSNYKYISPFYKEEIPVNSNYTSYSF